MGFAQSLAHRYVRHCFTVVFGVLLVTIAGHGFASILLPTANPLVWLLGLSLVTVVFSARRPTSTSWRESRSASATG